MKIKPQSSLKYFVGVDLPEHAKDELYHFTKNQLSSLDGVLDWISPHEYHVTLAYLGLITEEQRSRLIATVDRIFVPPFEVHLQGLGFHPPGKRPRSLWLGFGRGKEMFEAFGDRVRKEVAERAGLIPRDGFFPHVTVAKIKDKFSNDEYYELLKTIRENWDHPFGAFAVRSFHLYRIVKSGYAHNHEVALRSRPKVLKLD